MLEWFKISARMRYDRRLERLEAEAFRTYLYLCCLASERKPRWILTSDDLREFVGEFGLNGFNVVQVINAVRDLGLIEDIEDGWRFTQAEGWQQECGHPSDDAEAALIRQRRHRAKLPGYCEHGLSVTTCHECHDKRREESREIPPCSPPPPGGDGHAEGAEDLPKTGGKRRGAASSPRRPTREAPEFSEGFKRFYEIYPRHEEPRKAWACWQQLLAMGYTEAELIAAATHYAQTCRRTNRIAKLPASFLSVRMRPFEEWISGPPADEAPAPARRAGRGEARAQLVGSAAISEEEAMAAVGGGR
jgi:hypothetical protein